MGKARRREGLGKIASSGNGLSRPNAAPGVSRLGGKGFSGITVTALQALPTGDCLRSTYDRHQETKLSNIVVKNAIMILLVALSAVMYGCAHTDNGPSQADHDAVKAEAAAAEAAKAVAEAQAAMDASLRAEAEAAKATAEERAAAAEAAKAVAEAQAAMDASLRTEAEAAKATAEERAAAAEAALADPLNRLNGIVGKVNMVLISRLHVGGSEGTGFLYSCLVHACGGVSAGYLYAPAEISRWLFEDGFSRDREIGGLEIVQSNLDDDWRAFGAWMDHAAAFLSHYQVGGANGDTVDYFIASSFGSRSEEPLPVEGSATWQGAMVGVDVVTTDRYAGSANLVATFGDSPDMDVSFTDIANVETGASREDILFSDETPVGLYDGRFFGHSGHDDFNQAPIYIDGQFFGPNYAEAAGVFGYNELIGAFGASKQE